MGGTGFSFESTSIIQSKEVESFDDILRESGLFMVEQKNRLTFIIKAMNTHVHVCFVPKNVSQNHPKLLLHFLPLLVHILYFVFFLCSCITECVYVHVSCTVVYFTKQKLSQN